MKTRLFTLIICALFIVFSPLDLCFPYQPNDRVDRSQYSYLKGRNINTELLNFEYVRSYCFICWGDGHDDPWTGRQSHEIVYINDPDFKIKTKLASIRNNEAITFRIKFHKFADEKIVDRKIILPNDRFQFYSNSIYQDKKGHIDHDNNFMKLNVQSGYIELESLGVEKNSNIKTVGTFIIHLDDNEVIEGGFSVRPRIREYGP